MRPTPRCAHCRRFLPPAQPAWLIHREDCARFLDGFCGCAEHDEWLCTGCSPNTTVVTPLAARIRIAHQQQLHTHPEAA